MEAGRGGGGGGDGVSGNTCLECEVKSGDKVTRWFVNKTRSVTTRKTNCYQEEEPFEYSS